MIKKIYTKRYIQCEENIEFLYYKLSKLLIDKKIKIINLHGQSY